MSADNVSELYRILVPDTVWQALMRGDINPLQFSILFSLYRRAEPDTGRVSSFSADQVLYELGASGLIPAGDPSVRRRYIQRQMAALRKAGCWFTWDYKNGNHRPYNIWLTNFLVCPWHKIHSFITHTSSASPSASNSDCLSEYRIVNKAVDYDSSASEVASNGEFDAEMTPSIKQETPTPRSNAAQAEIDEAPAGDLPPAPSATGSPYSGSHGKGNGNTQNNSQDTGRVNQDAARVAVNAIMLHVAQTAAPYTVAKRRARELYRDAVREGFSVQDITDGFDSFWNQNKHAGTTIVSYFDGGVGLLLKAREDRVQAPSAAVGTSTDSQEAKDVAQGIYEEHNVAVLEKDILPAIRCYGPRRDDGEWDSVGRVFYEYVINSRKWNTKLTIKAAFKQFFIDGAYKYEIPQWKAKQWEQDFANEFSTSDAAEIRDWMRANRPPWWADDVDVDAAIERELQRRQKTKQPQMVGAAK